MKRRWEAFFEGQRLHLVALLGLLGGVALTGSWDARREGGLWGLSTDAWFALAIASPIVHQVYVWVCWRLELHGGHLTRRLGPKAFYLFGLGFAILISLRPALLACLAAANANTLDLSPALRIALTLVLALPAVYLGYSVKRYFGFRRAFGIDHFEASWREKPYVRQGIFRFASNAMYVFGFFSLWAIAVGFASAAALVVAAFSHLYIWVHYFGTERPDMRRIYGSPAAQGRGSEAG